MATFKIDGIDYDTDNLSEEAKAQVTSLLFVRNELTRIEAQRAVYKTAEAGYANALKAELGI